ncbi:MAG: triacylglycerol lipase [Clostridiales bacterium]|nr:triacylglycerol lipase [Clostridiales bacterium]
MYGGKILLTALFYSLMVQIVFYIIAYKTGFWNLPKWLIITDTVVSQVLIISYLLNGIIRVIALCYRLNIVKRVLFIMLLWVPIVNLFILRSLIKTAKEEYDYETTKKAFDDQRIESQVCQTKYPLMLVHGIGFKDWRYFNYWGRIPKELKKNGGAVYYGNQDACGTVAYNSEMIKRRILEIVEETGCEKVNIIAHSKGGLDARYAISKLGISQNVASLTTMGVPHRGSGFADVGLKLPDKLVRIITNFLDKRFRQMGDSNSDAYTAIHQFTSDYSEEFNRDVPDADGVYYQSYASVMRGMFSFGILAIPYLCTKKFGKNDGLVTIESAKWGNFRGTFESKHYRGISHGDLIDLKRDDYKGFDPRETYVNIVSELKEMGY